MTSMRGSTNPTQEQLADYERRRKAAAEQLIARFQRPDGFDYQALREASTQWLPRDSPETRCRSSSRR